MQRAARRCEYCRLPDAYQSGGFELDHVIPRAQGGQTVLDNLAAACPHCNDHKWAHTDCRDPVSGETVAIFNPRRDHWNEHFEWSNESLEIIGRTPCGRATIERLLLNGPELIAVRRNLASAGIPVFSDRIE
jgi:hypothetical protein